MQNVAHKMARIYDGPNPEKVTYKKWSKKILRITLMSEIMIKLPE